MASKKKELGEDLLGITFRGSKKETVYYTKRNTIKLNENGLLIYKIPYTDKWDYYPIFMARYSIGNLELFLDEGDEKYKEVFLKQTNWLYKNLTYKDDFAIWEHNYTLPYYDFKTPWTHGLAQGLGMTALLKNYQITDNKDFLKASEKVFNSFNTDISKGGVKYVDEKGNIWLEEYALLPPPHVLNGFITILFGIHEFHKVTGNKKALKLWNDGIKTIKTNLEKYEAGYWSIYDLLRRYPSTKNYHKLHIWQLKTLYDLTNEKMFLKYSKKWEKYNNSILNKKHASFQRGLLHLKRYGIFDSYNRYVKRKKWNRE